MDSNIVNLNIEDDVIFESERRSIYSAQPVLSSHRFIRSQSADHSLTGSSNDSRFSRHRSTIACFNRSRNIRSGS